MSRKILIMDTSILCCWLRVPGKETAGPNHDQWTPDRIEKLIDKEMEKKVPFASRFTYRNRKPYCASTRAPLRMRKKIGKTYGCHG